MQELKIRALEKRDLEEVYLINKEIFKSNAWSLKNFEDFLNEKQTVGLLLVLNNEITGFLLSKKVLDEAEIYKIGIKTRFQRKGFGTFLFKEFFKWCKNQGIRRVFLEVQEDNKGAIKFYKNLGFEEIGKRKDYYGRGKNAILMRLDLENIHNLKPKQGGKP